MNEHLFTFSIGNKELELVFFISHGKILCQVCQMVQYYDNFYLTHLFLWKLFIIVSNSDFECCVDDNSPYTTDQIAERVIDNYLY